MNIKKCVVMMFFYDVTYKTDLYLNVTTSTYLGHIGFAKT